MSKFESHINDIINGATPVDAKKKLNTKLASDSNSDISVESLRKIASILRTTEVEPTYSELAEFSRKVLH